MVMSLALQFDLFNVKIKAYNEKEATGMTLYMKSVLAGSVISVSIITLARENNIESVLPTDVIP